MRALPSVRSYSYLLNTVPGVVSNNNNVNTGPVFAIFPVHGGRGVESRLTVDGLNISNPPGGNQPPNFTADIGNAAEVTMTTSGGLGELETAGLTVNIVPKQGGNQMSGLLFVSGFSEGMQSDNFTAELQARGATLPNPVYHVYDVNTSIGGPFVRDKLWYYVSLRWQGQRQNTLNVYYNQNAGNASAFTYAPDLNTPAFSDRTWENYTPRITWQASQRHKFTFSWDEQPVCRSCTGTTSLTGSPNFIFPTSPEADGHGEFSPQRIQQARWNSPLTNKLLLEAGFGTTYYQWGGREVDPNPTRDLVQVVNFTQTVAPGVTSAMRYRSQSWLNNKTRGSTWQASASYITGSHSMKFGYQGNFWSDDREMHVNSQSLGYQAISLPGLDFFPLSIQEYINPYVVNARAMQALVLRAGSVDHQASDASGRAALRPPVELVPRAGRTSRPILPGRHVPAHRRRDRLQRHHAAHGCLVRHVRERQDGAQDQPREVSGGRQRQQHGVQLQSGTADPVRRRPVLGFRRHRQSVRLARLVRCELQQHPGLRPDQSTGKRRVRSDR